MTIAPPRNFPGRLAAMALIATGMSAPARAQTSATQNLGSAPQPGLDASNLYSAFQLTIDDAPGSPLGDAAAHLQVGMRAQKLGVTRQSALDAWMGARALVASPIASTTPVAMKTFNGTTASSLNQLLSAVQNAYIRVTSPALTLDEPIHAFRDGVTLDLGGAQLSSATPLVYMIRIEGAHNVGVIGGSFTNGNSAVLVSKSSNVVVDHMQISGLTGDGVVVSASTHVLVTHNRMSGLGGPGVILIAGTTLTAVSQNEIGNGTSQSNWAAGIVVSDRDVDLTADPRAIFDQSGYWPVAEPVRDRLNPPHDCLIAYNYVATNLSSGIYLDGGVRNTVFANTIQGNAKEGLCLDNGATANVVASNVIQQNGNRWGQPDAVLRLDFVSGRLPDGTAAAKLPGISMDNSLYNVIFGNNISHNFGGGLKMVRTGFFNVAGFNVIESDNDGVNVYFRFFGVELGAAGSDAPSAELDFVPSRGNVIFSNTIRGRNASGIFIEGGSDQNNMFDNIIMEATDYALESALPMANTSLNNLTNLPSRNIGSGCCNGTSPRRAPVRSM